MCEAGTAWAEIVEIELSRPLYAPVILAARRIDPDHFKLSKSIERRLSGNARVRYLCGMGFDLEARLVNEAALAGEPLQRARYILPALAQANEVDNGIA